MNSTKCINPVVQNLADRIKEMPVENFSKTEILEILRKMNSFTDQPVVESGEFTLDPVSFCVKKGEESFTIPRKEFQVMYYLIAMNRYVTRDELLNNVWGSDVFVGDRTVDVHIRKIRAKFGGEVIQTIKGKGYNWNNQL